MFCFQPNLIFFKFLTKKCKKFIFLEKNLNFGFFLIIWKKLRLGEKTKQKKKKNVPRAKYSLYDKSNNLDFRWPLFLVIWFETLPKTLQIEKWKIADLVKTVTFSLLPMPLFLNLQWEYVLQITDKHLYTMSKTSSFAREKWTKIKFNQSQFWSLFTFST